MSGIIQTIQAMLSSAPKYFSSHILLLVIWIILAIVSIVIIFTGLSKRAKSLDRSIAINLVNNKLAIFIDIRNDSDFFNGHIAGSSPLSLSDIDDKVLKSIEKYKNFTLILVTKDGTGYQDPAIKLIKEGYKVCGLKEGITGWTNANLPLISKK
ncbi:MAG: rhodanese-like domain-containing protein [Psittacicella sp.]